MCKPSKKATGEGGARGHGQNMLLIHSFLKELPCHRHRGFNLQAGGEGNPTTLSAVVKSDKCIPSCLNLNKWPLCFHAGDKEQNVEVCFDATLRKLTLATLLVRLRQLRRLSHVPFETCLCSARNSCSYLKFFLKGGEKKKKKTSPHFWLCGPNEVFISSADFTSK